MQPRLHAVCDILRGKLDVLMGSTAQMSCYFFHLAQPTRLLPLLLLRESRAPLLRIELCSPKRPIEVLTPTALFIWK